MSEHTNTNAEQATGQTAEQNVQTEQANQSEQKATVDYDKIQKMLDGTLAARFSSKTPQGFITLALLNHLRLQPSQQLRVTLLMVQQ